MTRTSGFGVSGRQSHDASAFYGSRMVREYMERRIAKIQPPSLIDTVAWAPLEDWADRTYCHSSTDMCEVPDNSVAAAFTSPPYNVGKEYGGDAENDSMGLFEYLDLFEQVSHDVVRTLMPGGRFIVNVAGLGRKPYIPMDEEVGRILRGLGLIPAGKIIWRKGKGASGSCAWGSWKSASNPSLRDVHEFLCVYVKDSGIVEGGVWKPAKRAGRGESTIERDEFMQATLSMWDDIEPDPELTDAEQVALMDVVWDVQPESATRLGVPAPFPVALAERVIRLFTFKGDVVLDPFMGSGSTAVAAVRNDRRYVGYDIVPEYCALTEERVSLARRGLPDKARLSVPVESLGIPVELPGEALVF